MPEKDDVMQTEAEIIASLGAATASWNMIDPGEVIMAHVPEGWRVETKDFEWLADQPRRAKGTTQLHDAPSFVRFVQEHSALPVEDEEPLTGATPDRATKVYGDIDNSRLTAVFNDSYFGRLVEVDGTSKAIAGPGWADHRAVLTLRKTEAWTLWEYNDGSQMTQGQFAEHIEDGLLEIVEPDGATLLEIAQTFHANTNVKFRSSQLLSSGQRQLVWEETTNATAGQTGSIEVPPEFLLHVAPFEGGDVFPMRARLRFRIESGSLRMSYKLVRPHDVLKAAYDEVCDSVSERTLIDVLRGTPPTSS
jgi:uncharacterized protein YfdQ (DUF2303 family)